MAPPTRRLPPIIVVTTLCITAAYGQRTTLGNFGISCGECNATSLVVNPPELNMYLTAATLPNSSGLIITVDGVNATFDAAFASATGDRVFPHCSLITKIGSLLISYNAFAPLSPGDADVNYLPFLVLQFEAYNEDSTPHELTVTYTLECDPNAGFCAGSAGSITDPSGTNIVLYSGSIWSGAWVAPSSTGSSSPFQCQLNPAKTLCTGINLWVAPHANERGTLFGGHRSATGRYNASFPDLSSLFAYAVGAQDKLAASTSAFISALPASGNATTDKTQRWFLQAPLLLTKGTLNLSLTMGYVELNQRDSFWCVNSPIFYVLVRQ